MSLKYDLYLEEHRENVKKGFDWLSENLPDLVGDTDGWAIEFSHDKSKNDPEEYDAYDKYFYGNNKSYAVVENFKRAWLTHIHKNPHHWQYWILVNDDPEEGEILQMPHDDVIEMICDWWSFSWSKGDLTEIFNWYDKHKGYMKLNPKTRKEVETILEAMKEKLLDPESFLAHHGVKGQKWGVRRTKEQLGHDKPKQVTGHNSLSKKELPNSVVDHISDNGKVKARAFYNSEGWKCKEIHTSNHGNPKHHIYGNNGEHIHVYEWNYDNGSMTNNITRELSDEERKENGDIL